MNVVIMLMLAFIIVDTVVETTITLNDALKLNDTDGSANDYFGGAVDIHGNTVVVGSAQDDVNYVENVGSIHIYTVNENGVELQMKLSPRVAQGNDNFGNSVATNTNYIIVGSVFLFGDQGSVYIYSSHGKTWIYTKIVANDAAGGEWFGRSVGINNNNDVVVGADSDKDGRSGSAYVFAFNGSDWVQKQKLVPRDLNYGGNFGISVAITNTHIAVGAFRQTNNNVYRSGSVYIYKKNTTAWDQQTKLKSPNIQAMGYFGYSVSLYGTRVVIGADREDSNKGKAYVYVNNVDTWVLEATLAASDGKIGDGFGISVSIHRHTIVIGARASDGKRYGSGSAYAFELIAGKWTEIKKLVSYDGKAGDRFGNAVSISNGNIVIGSPFNDAKVEDSGAAYIYNGLNLFSTTTTPQPTTTTSLSNQNNQSTSNQASGRAGVHYIIWFVVLFCFLCTIC